MLDDLKDPYIYRSIDSLKETNVAAYKPFRQNADLPLANDKGYTGKSPRPVWVAT
jgi:hypothetical protein